MVKNVLLGAAAVAFASSSMASAATRPAQSPVKIAATPIASTLPARATRGEVKKKNELAGTALIAVLAGAAVIGGIIAVADDGDDSPN